MSFFPAGFDPRSEVVACFDLVAIDTPDGVMRFLIGADGQFTDRDGNVWTGSTLLGVSALETAIDGRAPAGELSLSFFQDPDAPNLVAQIAALGADYVAGRPITFYFQPFNSLGEMYAPVLAPLPWLVRTMRQVTFRASGAQDRQIAVSFETAFESRATARRLALNTAGHAALIGEANPSLEFIPTVDFQEEKLF